ncbi:type I restriction enzyme [Moraxella macacae 0408225]|uniref:Type I restriction enzyme n=1 Tax=Moraxella macacae 0408225 TaxID=1230338 RepID=L2F9R9_9GAMM|nr:restriction endonuclease subunit S [Moraxella macacae]ELA09511.1 type I restriction enzyme [Moraxella macacae 0408225]
MIGFVERLLNGREVEWKSLGEVSTIKTGQAISKNKIANNIGIYPVINSGKEPLGYYNNWNTENNPIGITSRGVGVGSIIWTDGKYFRGNLNYSVTVNNNKILNVRFLYFILLHLQSRIHELCTFTGIPALNASNLKTLLIPIPPPDVQNEIVRVLDKYTALNDELISELNKEFVLRQKQYNYYRDKLLTFGDEVEYKTLNEVAIDFGRGKSKHRPRNDARLYGGEIPFVQTGDIRNAGHVIEKFTQTYSDFGLKQSKLWKKGTLCITIAANIAETSILGFDACFPDSVIGFVADPNKTSEKYVEYLLSSLKSTLQEKSTSGAQENLNLAAFADLRLPFPSLQEQQKIVSILDKFETLTNSISHGLPKEIKLRTKQYEYYREQLLGFNHSFYNH